MNNNYDRIIELIHLNASEEITREIKSETKFFEDLSFDSVALMNLLVDVEEEFGFETDDMEESLKAFETVGSFVEFVTKNKRGGGEP